MLGVSSRVRITLQRCDGTERMFRSSNTSVTGPECSRVSKYTSFSSIFRVCVFGCGCCMCVYACACARVFMCLCLYACMCSYVDVCVFKNLP